ncbi:borealin-2-like isoform X2 [Scyliorhinus canicula]|uniref:borealin-2-like isoform X2 n=1 Tax=Scyliorhinus canicula TaxID=7830 RepID=UPI0018F62E80|nr:borealin-2-like isoform X2 [Scyliorhinus canicula]
MLISDLLPIIRHGVLTTDGVHQKANEKIREMEHSFGKLIDMVGSVMAVYLLKMPTAIKQMKLKDFHGGTDQVTTAAVKVDYTEGRGMATLVKIRKKKGKAPLASNSKMELAESKCKAKLTTAKYCTIPKVSQTKPKPGSFPNCNKEMLFTSGPVLRSMKSSSQGAASTKSSVGDKKSGRKVQKCSYPSASVDKMLPFIKIPLADGQAISAVGEEVNNIDVQLLDLHALQGIQLLVTQLTALCEKAKNSAKHANSL